MPGHAEILTPMHSISGPDYALAIREIDYCIFVQGPHVEFPV